MTINFEELVVFVIKECQKHDATFNSNYEWYGIKYSPDTPMDEAVKAIAAAVEEEFNKV